MYCCGDLTDLVNGNTLLCVLCSDLGESEEQLPVWNIADLFPLPQVENIYCNRSGGCAMGSLGSDVDVSKITYKNIYTWASNQMYMIKSNGGSGSVSNVVLENFIGHGNSYSLDVDQAWASMSTIDGDGVHLRFVIPLQTHVHIERHTNIQKSNIQISNWTGTEEDGSSRGPVKLSCADEAPCTGVDITDFAMWTESGSVQWYSCQSAYTSLEDAPFCLQSGDDTSGSYAATTTTVTTAPTGYEASSMAEDLSAGFGTTASIPIPTWPSSFFPGVAPYSTIAANA